MRSITVRSSDLARRGSWAPSDFLYARGRHVRMRDGRVCVVVRHDGETLWMSETVWLSTVEFVPGSRTAFSCSVPEPVSIFDIPVEKPR